MKSVKKIAVGVREALNSPGKVLTYCSIFFVLTLSLNGVPLRLWGLSRDTERFESETFKTRNEIKVLASKLSQASDPAFIEKQALDRLDLVGENDLIFVFPTQ
jgi:hypothetical protein